MSELGPLFGAEIKNQTLAERVSDQILRAIIDNDLHAGDRLPSERELAIAYGVSRTVIREALRGLAASGIVEVRSGIGVSVGFVNASFVSDTIKLFLRGAEQLDYLRIHEARMMVELQIARIACQHATDEDIAALEEIHERMGAALDTPDKSAQADVEFHRLIASATHNPFYGIMLDSLRGVLLQVRKTALMVPGRAHRAYGFHGKILGAIRNHDGEAAFSAMKSHLEDVSSVLKVHRD